MRCCRAAYCVCSTRMWSRTWKATCGASSSSASCHSSRNVSSTIRTDAACARQAPSKCGARSTRKVGISGVTSSPGSRPSGRRSVIWRTAEPAQLAHNRERELAMHAYLGLPRYLTLVTLLVIGAASTHSRAFAASAYTPISPTMADRTITLTGHDLTTAEVVAVARYGAQVQL